MPELIPILSKRDIHARVSDIAAKISSDYKGKDLVVVGILKGAFIFLSDLVRYMSIPVTLDFIQVASYGDSTHSSGNIRLIKDLEVAVTQKYILVVEDIVDTGLTLKYIINYLNSFKPASIKICALLNKKKHRREEITIDYVCHEVKEGFLVGYGLDYAEKYRHLPEIFHLKL